jgi:hypothetical protein
MTIFIVSLLAVLGAPGMPGGSVPSWVHTRPMTPLAARMITEAGERVPLVRSMLDALERSDVFVYVSHHLGFSSVAPPAYLRFVTRAGGRRYVWVEINCWGTSEAERIGWLGHELQHALEIANAPEVRDNAGLTRFYGRIGFPVGMRKFETRAAQAMGILVRDQLASRR